MSSTNPLEPSPAAGVTTRVDPWEPDFIGGLLWRRRWQLLATSLTGAVLLAAGSYLIPPTFTGRTTFLPPQQSSSPAVSALASLGVLAGAGPQVRNSGDQYLAFLQSVSIRDRLVEDDGATGLAAGGVGAVEAEPAALTNGPAAEHAEVASGVGVVARRLGDRREPFEGRRGPFVGGEPGDESLLIVVGDYYMFGEYEERVKLKRLVRDFAINSKEDLVHSQRGNPEAIERYSDVAMQYLPASAAYALADLAPLLRENLLAEEVPREGATEHSLGSLPPLPARQVAADAPVSGERVGPYELIKPLGEGGMSSVWLADSSTQAETDSSCSATAMRSPV